MSPAWMIAGAGALTLTAQLARGQAPSPRVVIGAAVAGGALLLIAQGAPEAAGKFAGLVLTTALLTSGYDVAQGVARALNR